VATELVKYTRQYFQEKGIQSFEELDSVELRQLILNHLLTAEIETNSMPDGSLSSRNAIGDYIVSGFVDSDIIINKVAKIIDRDIQNVNGSIHVIDKVLEPYQYTVFDVLSNDPGYSIFVKGLEITNIKDTLKNIEFNFGNIKMFRSWFTILAIHDSIFNKWGVNSVDDLIVLYANGDENFSSKTNGFYRYFEYHCLKDALFLSDFSNISGEKNKPSISEDMTIHIEASDKYIINPENDSVYTRIFDEWANIPAKNGVIHPIDGLLPVDEPIPEKWLWNVTYHLDTENEEWFLNHYARFNDGQNTFANIKWQGDFLLYYLKSGPNHSESWQLNGYFWIEITTPKIPKGKYDMFISMLVAAESPDLNAYLDGERVDGFLKGRDPSSWDTKEIFMTTVDFESTESHKIRLETINFGLLFWKEVICYPVIE